MRLRHDILQKILWRALFFSKRICEQLGSRGSGGDRGLGGDVSARMSAHPVGHGPESEMVHRDEGVLIHRADETDVGPSDSHPCTHA